MSLCATYRAGLDQPRPRIAIGDEGLPLSIPLVLGGLFWIGSIILRKPKSGWTR